MLECANRGSFQIKGKTRSELYRENDMNDEVAFGSGVKSGALKTIKAS